jgi:hypothetical protein
MVFAPIPEHTITIEDRGSVLDLHVHAGQPACVAGKDDRLFGHLTDPRCTVGRSMPATRAAMSPKPKPVASPKQAAQRRPWAR